MSNLHEIFVAHFFDSGRIFYRFRFMNYSVANWRETFLFATDIKMNSRLAVLDLGTNTFHLLVAELKGDRLFDVLFKAEEFVQLGEEGVDRIGDRAFQRGVEQVKKYKSVIDELKADQVIGFGTAAIRKASNGDDFIAALKEICPMELRKISGDEEAELIYYGVKQAVKMDEHPVLIMDIGGGSTEFIIANNEKIFWKQSFPAGGSVLKKKFHHREPISAIEQVNMIHFLQHELIPVIEQMKIFSIRHLIGASGSFDTLANMISENIHGVPLHPADTSTEVPMREFYILCDRLIHSIQEERLKMNGLIWFRAETIVAAAILAGYVVETFNIHRITRSGYALKEGALWRTIQQTSI
ncbi:MAG: hypothetical protein ACHQD9_00760 [Chitinophagales bacterium]